MSPTVSRLPVHYLQAHKGLSALGIDFVVTVHDNTSLGWHFAKQAVFPSKHIYGLKSSSSMESWGSAAHASLAFQTRRLKPVFSTIFYYGPVKSKMWTAASWRYGRRLRMHRVAVPGRATRSSWLMLFRLCRAWMVQREKKVTAARRATTATLDLLWVVFPYLISGRQQKPALQ